MESQFTTKSKTLIDKKTLKRLLRGQTCKNCMFSIAHESFDGEWKPICRYMRKEYVEKHIYECSYFKPKKDD